MATWGKRDAGRKKWHYLRKPRASSPAAADGNQMEENGWLGGLRGRHMCSSETPSSDHLRPLQRHAECERAGSRMYKRFITSMHDRGQLVRRPHCFCSLFPAPILPPTERRGEKKNPPVCLWSSRSFDEKLRPVFVECGETLPHRGKSDQA